MQTAFEFGDLFTQAARHAVVVTRSRGLGFGFDYHGPMLRWRSDAAQTRAALSRVLESAIDVLEDGFVFFTARVAPLPASACHVAVAAASTGAFGPVSAWRRALGRLDLQGVQWMSDEALLACERPATGVCPITGGRVAFVHDAREGSLFSLEIELLPSQAWVEEDELGLDAGGARAWLINPGTAGTRSLERRLQRLGWATRVFGSVDAARRELERMASTYVRPALVLAYQDAGATAAALRPLAMLLPPDSRVVLAVAPDAALEASSQTGEHGIEVRQYPFSPSELVEFTRGAVGHPGPSGETMPAPLAFEHRKRALVVDDNAVNQLVASGMLQVLGFEVDTASDGLEAIARCMQEAPDLVLMDLHMPGMDGLEATRRLRLLQREGAMPPFPIVAATADTTSQEACVAAGMDGHLPKPLNLAGLEHQLRRLVPR